MDNGLIQTLFYILIIVFFLSSVFKKKHNPPKTRQTEPLPQDKENYSSGNDQSLQHQYKKDEKNKDILEEVENLFKDKPEEAYRKPHSQTKNENYSDKDFETEPTSQRKNQTLQNEDSSKNIILENMVYNVQTIYPKIEEEAKRFEQLLSQHDITNNFANEIRNKIFDIQLLKEYFIVSEILGKPKALRR